MKVAEGVGSIADSIFEASKQNIYTRTDGLFSKLFLFEYFAGIAFSIFVSPSAWPEADTNDFIFTAVVLGAVICAVPLVLIRIAPGKAVTRHTVAIAQMLIAGLWIHLSGGRIESHFHIYGSIALLGFYRDRKVLTTAFAVSTLDEIIRGILWPESIYGVTDSNSFRWLEHASWAFFEILFISIAIRQSLRGIKNSAIRDSKLRVSEREYRTLFEMASSGNWAVDIATARVTKVNKKACELFGYKKEELIGMHLGDLVPDDEKEERVRVFHQAPTTGAREYAAEKRYKRKDGTIFWTILTAAYVYDESDKPITALATIQDITKLKTTEQQLAEAKTRAEEANQAKTEFLTNMSHEIRTPLGAMLGFTELMLEDPNVNEDAKKNLFTVLRNGEQLYRIIDDVLDISKIEAKTIEVRKTKFNLIEVLSDTISQLSTKAREKGLTLNYRFNSSISETVFSDPTRLRQILNNVIGNSIKFTEKGSVQLDIGFIQNGDSSILEIKVSDTGPGIVTEKRGKLFQPFTQSDSAISRRHGGTGLGLFLSKRLASALGGAVVLEDYVDGKGCTFVITIDTGPLESTNLIDMKTWKKTSRPYVTPSTERLDGIRVLAVDDSTDNLQLTSRFLSGGGAIVECAEGAESAIKQLQSKDFDVVIMDIQMPLVDGYQAIRKLRAMNYKKPVIALTAHAMIGEREKCLEAGFNEYLVKPINKVALIETVKRLHNSCTRESKQLSDTL